MARMPAWGTFIWNQVVLRYVRALHVLRISRAVSRALIAVLIAVTVVGAYATTTYAADLKEIGGIGITAAACAISGPACIAMAVVFIILGAVLLIVVYLLFNLLQFLVWMLLQIASYNDFAHATVVDLGWVVMRDVVNMFFIVVLLVIAFSTIIRYKAFHYKDHLPKLLLMAVLINFSRTLVGVMIDFSQVITLTFVNGFAQAATGNFMKVFGVAGLLQAVEDAGGIGDLGTTLIAELFAVMILVISCTTLTILLLYFLIRVVSLWVLVILSPLAFFATALPGKLQKALGPLTGPWWSQLSAWLTGGPIVAFFLWLSLAVAQQGTNEFTTIVGGISDQETQNNKITSTEVGKPENFGLLIISVVLMLTGVKTAVSVAGSTGNSWLGKKAESIRSGYGPAGWLARQTGRRVGETQRFGKIAQGAVELSQQASQRWSKVPVVGALGAAGFTMATGKIRKTQGVITKDAQKRAESRLEGLSPSEQLTAIDDMLAGKAQIRSFATESALNRKRVTLATSGGGQKAIAKQEEEIAKKKAQEALEKEIRKNEPTWNDAQVDAEVKKGLSAQDGQIKARAADAAKVRLQKILAEGKKSAQDGGDDELVKTVDEAYKKNPGLNVDPKEVAKAIRNLDKDSMIDASAMQDTLVSAALLEKHDLVDENGALRGTEQEILDSEPIKRFLSLGGDRALYLKAAVHDFAGSKEGKERLEALSKSLRSGVPAGDEQLSRSYLSKTADGTQILFANSRDKNRPEPRGAIQVAALNGGRVRMSTEADVTSSLPETNLALPAATRSAAQAALSGLALNPAQFTAPLNVEQAQSLASLHNVYMAPLPASGYSNADRAVMTEAQVKGLLSSVAFRFDSAANKFASVQDEDAAQTVYAEMMQKMDSTDTAEQNRAIQFITNTDVDAVAKSGEMRDVVAKAFNTATQDQIRKLFGEATREQAKQLKTLMKELSRQAELINNRGGAVDEGERNLVEFRSRLSAKEMRKFAGEEGKT